MAVDPIPVLFSWSGGKDSALALYRLQQDPRWHVRALICTFTRPFDRLTMHGVRRALILAQAEALGLPVISVEIPAGASNAAYEAAWEEALAPYREQGVRHVAFGDIFLEDVRAYRERQLTALGMEMVEPIWTGSEDPARSRALLEAFWQAGFRTRIVCADARFLGPEWVGRELTPSALAALPEGVDPCGERGEFHTFVFAGPMFRHPIVHHLGRRVTRDGFHYRDLLPGPPP